MKAISVRQPWAWLIVRGHKDIENRSQRTSHRGPLLIHASITMKKRDYDDAAVYAMERGVTIPPAENLERGGVIGKAEIVDCVDKSPSPWFMGPIGYVIENPEPLMFHACAGQLGIFTPNIAH